MELVSYATSVCIHVAERGRMPTRASGVLENVDFRGGDLDELGEIDSVAGCVAACRTTVNCSGWTLKKASQACFVKHAGFTPTAANKSEGLISGRL